MWKIFNKFNGVVSHHFKRGVSKVLRLMENLMDRINANRGKILKKINAFFIVHCSSIYEEWPIGTSRWWWSWKAGGHSAGSANTWVTSPEPVHKSHLAIATTTPATTSTTIAVTRKRPSAKSPILPGTWRPPKTGRRVDPGTWKGKIRPKEQRNKLHKQKQ